MDDKNKKMFDIVRCVAAFNDPGEPHSDAVDKAVKEEGCDYMLSGQFYSKNPVRSGTDYDDACGAGNVALATQGDSKILCAPAVTTTDIHMDEPSIHAVRFALISQRRFAAVLRSPQAYKMVSALESGSKTTIGRAWNALKSKFSFDTAITVTFTLLVLALVFSQFQLNYHYTGYDPVGAAFQGKNFFVPTSIKLPQWLLKVFHMIQQNQLATTAAFFTYIATPFAGLSTMAKDKFIDSFTYLMDKDRSYAQMWDDLYEYIASLKTEVVPTWLD